MRRGRALEKDARQLLEVCVQQLERLLLPEVEAGEVGELDAAPERGERLEEGGLLALERLCVALHVEARAIARRRDHPCARRAGAPVPPTLGALTASLATFGDFRLGKSPIRAKNAARRALDLAIPSGRARLPAVAAAGMSAGERGAGGAEQSRLIAEYLDENNKLLEAIVQNQNAGRLHECIQYQLQLQQNLIYLATLADKDPRLRPLLLSAPDDAAALRAGPGVEHAAAAPGGDERASAGS